MLFRCGTRIQALYLENHIKRERLAEILGIPLAELARYEEGALEPTGETALKIADHLNVSLDFLAGRTTERGGIGMEDALLDPLEQQDLARLLLKMIRNYFKVGP
mgnify:FL=1